MSFAMKKGLDNLGRLVIPKNMRDYYGISANDKVILVPTESGILITKCIKDNNGGASKTSVRKDE